MEGRNFHGDANCRGVKDKFLPLSPLTLDDLYTSAYEALTLCPYCSPPRKPSDLPLEVPEDVMGIGEGDDTGAEGEEYSGIAKSADSGGSDAAASMQPTQAPLDYSSGAIADDYAAGKDFDFEVEEDG